jgi:hypothetical protein
MRLNRIKDTLKTGPIYTDSGFWSNLLGGTPLNLHHGMFETTLEYLADDK